VEVHKARHVKPKLAILSDLWGTRNCEWVQYYQETLGVRYEVQFLDSRELAGIHLDLDSEQAIHQQFVQGGIDIAVNTLLKNSFDGGVMLGFSIGGLIAWKGLEGGTWWIGHSKTYRGIFDPPPIRD